jgi:tol-pal system protein YbgF
LISRSPGYLLAGFVMLAALPAAAQEGGGVAANQELRIQQLESEIRGLTGQVEDLSYQVRSLTDQLQKLVADTDFRLREVEGGAGATTGSTPAGGEPPPVLGEPAGTTPPQAAEANPPPPPAEPANPPLATVGGTNQPATNQPPTSVGQPRTLGTMSETDFEAQKSKLKAADATAAAAAAGQANSQAAAPAGQGGQTAALSSGGTPDEQYQNAFSLLRATKYNEAERALKSFIAQYPDHPLTGNANYWLGETYYVRADYNNAALTFAEGFKKYPKSGKAPDNLLKLGMSLAALGERDDACKALVELESRYPNANDNVKQRAAKERQRNGC